MSSNFIIQCSECLNYTDLFNEDYFQDEFLDDTGTTDFICPYCKIELEIKTKVEYFLSADVLDWE